MKTLLLTPWGTATKILPWQDAVKMKYEETADVVSEYDIEICSPSITWKMPAVMRLRKMPPLGKRGIKFSRTNVYLRDGYRCQYCGSDSIPVKDLTYDHCIPRCQGGKTDWRNVTLSCKKCNSKKGGRTCQEANMFPINKPIKPASLPFSPTLIDIERAPEEWLPWLKSTNF